MDKNFTRLKKYEEGQILPFLVVGVVVLLTLAALILDGGVIMSNRRSAQAAADAGALAGAQQICFGETEAIIEAKALEYTIDMNGATSATADYNPDTGLVTVNASIDQASWFARIFGVNTNTSGAVASAGCYYPSIATRVLPIAFYYESPPVDASDANCDEDGACDLVKWPFEYYEDGSPGLMPSLDSANPLDNTKPYDLPLDNIYVVAETTKVCEKDVSGDIVCVEMTANESGGNRVWIDLSFLKGPPNNLKNIIQDGIDDPLRTPAWINGEPGVDSAVFNEANYTDFEKLPGYADLPVRLFYVPVFDKYCDPTPGNDCPFDDNFDDLPEDYQEDFDHDPFEYLVNENQQSYRLIGFAPFVITCVTKNDKCEFGTCIPANIGANTTAQPICPGYLAMDPSTLEYKSALEGYFVDEFPGDEFVTGTGGVDVGLYIISLSE